MPSPIVGLVGAVAGSSVLGGVSANKQAKAQKEAVNDQVQLADKINQQNIERFDPYYKAGTESLGNAMNLINNQAGAYADIEKSPEFAALNNAATRNVMAQSEAAGGTGNTSTINRLQTIAPQLIPQMYQDKVNLAMMPVNMGMQAAGKQAGYNQQYGSTVGNLYSQRGDINAAKAAIPFQAGQSLISSGISMFGPSKMGGMNMGGVKGF